MRLLKIIGVFSLLKVTEFFQLFLRIITAIGRGIKNFFANTWSLWVRGVILSLPILFAIPLLDKFTDKGDSSEEKAVVFFIIALAIYIGVFLWYSLLVSCLISSFRKLKN